MESDSQNLRLVTDEELMVLYQSGEANAFEILYERHSARVYGFFLKKLRDRSLVGDVHQAAFMKLHQARRQYDPSLPFAPWLFTICRSSFYDFLKARRRSTENEIWDPASYENATVLEKENKPDLPSLEGLPISQQEALNLRYLEDLSFEEIAQRLETSPTNVRQLVSRALRRLKSLHKDRSGEAQ